MTTNITSHTIVKNGMPFIKPVLENVLPFVDLMMITVSEKSSDGTLDFLTEFSDHHLDKVLLGFENVENTDLLTEEKNKQILQTKTKWILALDDDDYWPQISLRQLHNFLQASEYFYKDVDGFAFNPIQLNKNMMMDRNWVHRWFPKLYKNQQGLRQEGYWPRDFPHLNGVPLNWKEDLRVKRLPMRFFHLSHLKPQSFRDDYHNENFRNVVGKLLRIPEKWEAEAEWIYSYVR